MDDPIDDPAREVLFTSNVMLTTPDASTDIAALPYPADLRDAIAAAADEPQRYWFDHPIQIGVDPAANELLYGLRGLDAAIAAEPSPGRTTLLLSVSVTHDGLAPIARRYLAAELAREGRLRHLEVIIVTEEDTRRLIEEVLLPALGPAGEAAAPGLHGVVGVDGHYGRHYSFLKAVAGLWQVAIDPGVRATFKIDLDQVFPQAALLAETGKTMFGHLCTPLWGARARDADGHELWLGMLAGALVNERDIGHGLFTPDVPIPEDRPMLDEHVFFSALPQAISTRAEMMERYQGPERDGVSRALQRIHVTGGTTGIRVDALRACRPFTPSWVGRAEDQAYLLSVMGRPGPRLAYAHAAGLLMRHDKEAFAGQSMAAARIGKLIGDDVRILVFSAYVDALAGSAAEVGAGCTACSTPSAAASPRRHRARWCSFASPFAPCTFMPMVMSGAHASTASSLPDAWPQLSRRKAMSPSPRANWSGSEPPGTTTTTPSTRWRRAGQTCAPVRCRSWTTAGYRGRRRLDSQRHPRSPSARSAPSR